MLNYYHQQKNKKYMIYNPQTNKYVHFRAMGYINYTKYIQIFDLKTAIQIFDFNIMENIYI